MEEDMKCAVCSRAYSLSRLPIKSPCRHCMCNQCAFQGYASGSFRCPFCYQTSVLAEAKLPIHRPYYQSLLKSLNSRCADHRKTLNWYCRDCQQMLCKLCVSQHTRHDFLDLKDRQLRSMIEDKVAATEEKLKSPLVRLSAYRERLQDALKHLDNMKAKIQQDIKQKTKALVCRLKSLAAASGTQLQALHGELKTVLLAQLRATEEQQVRTSATYSDFASTAGSLKSLDVCSQLKLVDKLSAWPGCEVELRVEPQDCEDDFAALGREFSEELAEVLREELTAMQALSPQAERASLQPGGSPGPDESS